MDSIERANQSLILRLLPVFDDFDLAFANVPADLNETDAAWIAGFRQIQKKLTDALSEEGLAVIDDTGSPFDPNRHEAISSEPNDEVESEHIIQTLRAGYEHKSRILRPALVRVAA
jgi:molecular chaperone GrpE